MLKHLLLVLLLHIPLLSHTLVDTDKLFITTANGIASLHIGSNQEYAFTHTTKIGYAKNHIDYMMVFETNFFNQNGKTALDRYFLGLGFDYHINQYYIGFSAGLGSQTTYDTLFENFWGSTTYGTAYRANLSYAYSPSWHLESYVNCYHFDHSQLNTTIVGLQLVYKTNDSTILDALKYVLRQL